MQRINESKIYIIMEPKLDYVLFSCVARPTFLLVLTAFKGASMTCPKLIRGKIDTDFTFAIWGIILKIST